MGSIIDKLWNLCPTCTSFKFQLIIQRSLWSYKQQVKQLQIEMTKQKKNEFNKDNISCVQVFASDKFLVISSLYHVFLYSTWISCCSIMFITCDFIHNTEYHVWRTLILRSTHFVKITFLLVSCSTPLCGQREYRVILI